LASSCGHLRVVLGLALVEACVLQHQHFARLERRRGRFRFGAGRCQGENLTGALISVARWSAVTFMLYLGSGPSLGRPKWLIRISAAPWSSRYLIVGSAARMRVVVGNGAGGLVLREH
jgi:hypothetical protein